MSRSMISRLFLVALIGSLSETAIAATATAPGATIYVAPSGKDTWSGKFAEPNAVRSDGPLATLEGAEKKIAAMKKAHGLPAGGVTVVLSSGTYALTQTLQLGKDDSGTTEAPIVYRAAEGAKVQVIGGRVITGFVPYKGSILKAKVSDQGLKGVNFRQLFFNGKRQRLARYPNFDAENPYGGGFAYVEGKIVNIYDKCPGANYRSFHYKAKDARKWSNPSDGELFIFPHWNWYNSIVPIASIDSSTRTINLTRRAAYDIRPGDRYYVQGLFEELDAPGEWYLDRKTETLYFWPPEPLDGKLVYAPVLRTLIHIAPSASHITIRGFSFECCEGSAILVDQADDCLVAGNTIHNVGDFTGCGVEVKGGHRNGVVGNDIYDVGCHGILLTGGDRMKLIPAENFADNNYIHHPGVYFKQGLGIRIEGVGNRATHNLIHDCPRMAILFTGNNLAIEYNHIRHTNLETADTGAIYTGGRDWLTSRGSRICYNYFHDNLGYGMEDKKWVSPHYSWQIYLDDNAGGVDVIGNIVVRSSHGLMHLHNARDSVIENNIFVDGTVQQLEYSGWTTETGFWKTSFPEMVRMYELAVKNPLWKKMRNMDIHPSKAVQPNGMTMTDNVVRRNIFYYHNHDAYLYRLRNTPLYRNEWDSNLVYHFGQPLRVEYTQTAKVIKGDPESRPSQRDAPTTRLPKWWQAMGEDKGSIVADPLFVDPSNDDYRLQPESPAVKLGFKPIPVEKIGPYEDPLRASWPIVEAEGAREKPLISEQ